MSLADELSPRCGNCSVVWRMTLKEAVARLGAEATPYDVRLKARYPACADRPVDVWLAAPGAL